MIGCWAMQHSMRVALLVKQILLTCGFSYSSANTIGAYAAFHDVGKAFLPTCVLGKPGRLTDAEYKIIQRHPAEGAKFLLQHVFAGEKNLAVDIAQMHHERVDGSGYPDGITGSSIPFEVQIASLADVYDALTSKRPYKKVIDSDTAIRMILGGKCGVFSSEIKAILSNKKTQIAMKNAIHNPLPWDEDLEKSVASIMGRILA